MGSKSFGKRNKYKVQNVYKGDDDFFYVVLKTKSEPDMAKLKKLDLEISIIPEDDKRSNNANAYCWDLCSAIGAVTHLTKEDVYRDAVRNNGPYKDYELSEDKAKALSNEWESFGTGWITETVDFSESGENVILRCYYGTSTYNTRQMSLIIDYLVGQAEHLEIEVLPENKRQKLISDWKKQHK